MILQYLFHFEKMPYSTKKDAEIIQLEAVKEDLYKYELPH